MTRRLMLMLAWAQFCSSPRKCERRNLLTNGGLELVSEEFAGRDTCRLVGRCRKDLSSPRAAWARATGYAIECSRALRW